MTTVFLLPEDGVILRNVVNNKVILFFKSSWSLLFQEYKSIFIAKKILPSMVKKREWSFLLLSLTFPKIWI